MILFAFSIPPEIPYAMITAVTSIATTCHTLFPNAAAVPPNKPGLDFTRFLTPELTTVCQNVPEIAKRSVDTIIRMIDGKKIEEMEQIVDVTFRKGEST